MSQGTPLSLIYLQNGSGTGGAGFSLDVLLAHLDAGRFRPIVWTCDDGLMVRRWEGRGARVVVRRMHLFEGLDTHFVQGAIERDPSGWRRSSLQALTAARAAAALPGEIAFLRRLRARQGVVVHVNSIVALSAGLAARLLGLPIVWHVREILAPGVWGRIARRIILYSASRIVAVSAAAAAPFQDAGVPVQVVHNAIELKAFDPSLDGAPVRRELGLPPDTPVVGFVGRLFPSKGTFDLLQAMSIVSREFPGAHLLIVGGDDPPQAHSSGATWKGRLRRRLGFGQAPDYLPLLRSEADRLGLGDRVHLLGPRHDTPRLLAAMDVVALPSRTEAFGRTIIEAMAMARPVVSVAVEGILDLIRHDENGILIPPPSRVEDLAVAIAALLKDPGRREALGREGRLSVVDRFSAERHARAIMAVYEDLAAGHIGRQVQMPRAY
ncbi:MAG TPA: glycosyltransferase family 4 protein [Candidatus Polarisedimenticolia bacterium]|nr:glycosyltransferase family 4 protein [Candidatus Polarisedimenticolia bacterium]